MQHKAGDFVKVGFNLLSSFASQRQRFRGASFVYMFTGIRVMRCGQCLRVHTSTWVCFHMSFVFICLLVCSFVRYVCDMKGADIGYEVICVCVWLEPYGRSSGRIDESVANKDVCVRR